MVTKVYGDMVDKCHSADAGCIDRLHPCYRKSIHCSIGWTLKKAKQWLDWSYRWNASTLNIWKKQWRNINQDLINEYVTHEDCLHSTSWYWWNVGSSCFAQAGFTSSSLLKLKLFQMPLPAVKSETPETKLLLLCWRTWPQSRRWCIGCNWPRCRPSWCWNPPTRRFYQPFWQPNRS